MAFELLTLEQAQELFPGSIKPSLRWILNEAPRLNCGRRMGKTFYVYDATRLIEHWRADRALSAERIRQLINDESCTTVGSIYFVRCGDFVKVGFAVDVQKRIRCLQASNPLELVILGTIGGSISAEAAIHALLKERHHRFEWFHLHPDLLRVIEELCECP